MCVFLSIDSLSKAEKMNYFRYAGILGGYIVCHLLTPDRLEDC